MSPRVLARTSPAIIALLVAMFAVVPAAAKPPDDPRQKRASDLADSADVLFQREQWDAALEQFRNASAVMPSPGIALFEARCLVKLGRLIEADEAYRRVESFVLPPNATEVSRRAIVSGREEGGVMRARIPKLTLTFDADARDTVDVRMDGRPVAPSTFEVEQSVDPGVHRVEATKKGDSTIWAAETFTLKEGERRSVGVRPKIVAVALVVPPPSPPPPVVPTDRGKGRRTMGYVALGIGGVGLVTGVTAGMVMVGKKGQLNGACPNNVCPPSAHADLDGFRTARSVSTVGYTVSVVGLGLGALLVISAPKQTTNAHLTAFVGPSEAGLRGSF